MRGLIHLVQMNAIEFHGWGARADDIEKPDRLVFDLDPGEGVPWDAIAEGARRVRGMLEDLGLESFLKTTGGKGLHVVVPIRRSIDWEQARAFARAVAERLEAEEPEKYLANMSKERRKGKVFVDYLRNQRGATSVLPFSARARAGGTVSMPVAWEEAGRVRPDRFTVRAAAKLLASRPSDPWRSFGRVRQGVTRTMLRSLGVD